MVVVCLAVAAWLALDAARLHFQELRQLLDASPERAASARFAELTVGAALLLVVALALVPARWRRRALGASLAVGIGIPVLTSRNLFALGAAVALLVLSSWLGSVVATLLLRPTDRLIAWVVGSAYGLGLLAMLGGGLGRVGLLRAWVIWPLLGAAVALTLAFPIPRRFVRGDLAGVIAWLRRPDRAGLPQWLALGLLLGAWWIALIGALAPEIGSDAIRQRLAAAALFAREGRLVTLATLTLSVQPGLGELAYAVALACGPLPTAKLLNLGVGLWCGAGVWALGRRLAGRRAALVALLLYGTTPFVIALHQVAYGDLFATLFALAAALALVARPCLTPGAVGAALLSIVGGLAVKASFRLIAVGLFAALAAAIWRDWGRRLLPTRRHAALALVTLLIAATVGGVLAGLFGRDLPGTALVQPRLEAYRLALRTHLDNPERVGVGRSPDALVSLPFALLRRTERFGEMRGGFAGYAWPLALPLLALTRPNRRRWPLLIGTGVGLLAWALLAQYLRYAAPLTALLAALAGAAYALVARRSGRPVAIGLPLLLLPLCALWPIGHLNTTLAYPGDLPYRVVFGQQSRDAYLNEHVVAYTPLQLLNREEGATRAIAAYEYPQLYSRVPLYSVAYTAGVADEAILLHVLDTVGYSHVVIDRGFLSPDWDRHLVTDEDFLRRNAILVGGNRNAYLYRLLPPEQRKRDQEWARGPELLPNTDLEEPNGINPRGWTPFGRPRYDRSGAAARSGQAAFRGTPQDWYTATVPVTPQTRYLLSHATRADGDAGFARLQVNWLSAADQLVGVSLEVVPTSPQRYFRYSMLATAPPGATRARIYLVPQQGAAWFDDASFRAAPPEAQALPLSAQYGKGDGCFAAAPYSPAGGVAVAGFCYTSRDFYPRVRRRGEFE